MAAIKSNGLHCCPECSEAATVMVISPENSLQRYQGKCLLNKQDSRPTVLVSVATTRCQYHGGAGRSSSEKVSIGFQ